MMNRSRDILTTRPRLQTADEGILAPFTGFLIIRKSFLQTRAGSAEIMGIPTHDLFSMVKNDFKAEHLLNEDVHYTEAGYNHDPEKAKNVIWGGCRSVGIRKALREQEKQGGKTKP